MKRLVPVLTRFFIIFAIAAAGYLGYSRLSSSDGLPPQISSILTSLQEKSPIKINTDKIALKAKEKLVDQQPIIQDQPESEMKPSVMGDTSTAVSQQAKEIVSDTTEKITSQLQNLPKEQAANIVRQTCEQIISELEK